MSRRILGFLALSLTLTVSACAKKDPAVTPEAPPPSAFPGAVSTGAAAGSRPADPPPVVLSDTPIRSSAIPTADNRSLDDLNGPESPLKAVIFAYDSDELDEAAKKVLTANADLLKANRGWVVTIEGHCDERGSAEYNLALGDRRALAARNFLVTLGVGADRLRTVSYGKEFPYDPGHTETAWAKNRRAHFMLTAK